MQDREKINLLSKKTYIFQEEYKAQKTWFKMAFCESTKRKLQRSFVTLWLYTFKSMWPDNVSVGHLPPGNLNR